MSSLLKGNDGRVAIAAELVEGRPVGFEASDVEADEVDDVGSITRYAARIGPSSTRSIIQSLGWPRGT